jgi:GntP family gluconate:H+ symporter
MATTLDVDVGVMILVGAVVALPAAVAGMAVSIFLDRWLNIPFRDDKSVEREDHDPHAPYKLPALFPSVLPIVLPVLLISANTVLKTLDRSHPGNALLQQAVQLSAVFGNTNLALLLSAVSAMVFFYQRRQPTFSAISQTVETSLMSAGTIVLIVAAGGAFGEMLKVAGIGEAIQHSFSSSGKVSGLFFLLLGYSIAAVIKIAQGSSTVAMITVSGMMAAMIADVSLGYHSVYLATAIGAGSLMGSWMNDSGFWIFTKMGRFTETEGLWTWTLVQAVLSLVNMAVTLLLANVLPLE